jgi:hypothetical protein
VASILVVGTIFINIYDFNPEVGQEADQARESLLMEKSPEPSTTALEEAIDQEKEIDEEPVVSEAQDARGRGADKKLEAPDDREEVLVQDLDVGLKAVEEEGDLVMDESEVGEAEADDAEVDDTEFAAPQMAREEVREMAPEMDEEMAPAPEADAIMAVEAAPTRRQKRAMSRARTVPSSVDRLSGVVVSAEDMNPLPGASLMVKGTDSGYVADMQGRFSVPAGEKDQTTVVASYVGMVTNEHQLDSDQEHRVVLQPDLAMLDEVVVVDYDAQKETYPVRAAQKVQLEQENDYTDYKGAEPEGGIEAYKMYMEKNLRYPAGDTLGKREVVVLRFTVKSDGKLNGILILRSPGEAFSEEAIRLLEEGPNWNPARDENGTTDDVVRMRIVFKK